MTTLLQTHKLTLDAAGRQLVVQLDLQIRAGQCWAVLGPNGAGKSTLLHALAGLADPHLPVAIDQRPLDAISGVARARQLGILLQHSERGFRNTVLEMVLSGRYPHLGKWGWETERDRRLAKQALIDVGLADWDTRRLDSLSGGELRRVEIARLLAQGPRLALLDEPLNHLDIGQQEAMLALLRRRFTQPGSALLAVLHDVNQARRFADHCLLLSGEGHWLAGPVTQIATCDNLTRLLGYPLREAGPDDAVLISDTVN